VWLSGFLALRHQTVGNGRDGGGPPGPLDAGRHLPGVVVPAVEATVAIVTTPMSHYGVDAETGVVDEVHVLMTRAITVRWCVGRRPVLGLDHDIAIHHHDRTRVPGGGAAEHGQEGGGSGENNEASKRTHGTPLRG